MIGAGLISIILKGCSMTIEKKPTRRFVDVSVGQRFASQRQKLGLVAQEMADALGLSLEQLTARETGKRGFLASELFVASKLLNVHPSWFFESLKIIVTEWPEG